MTEQKTFCYQFEKDNPSYGTDAEVDHDLTVFVTRLGLEQGKEPDAVDKILLKRYVQTNHRAADWYGKVRDKKRKSRENYAWGRIILLALIPLSVLGLTFFMEGQAAVTQATILLTGLIAAFRASSEWMENTYAASNFAKAASELKESIYAFEGQWNGKAFNGAKLKEEAQNALLEGITKAREIVRKQRESYFTDSAPPSVDIMTTLDTAKATATKLIANFQSPHVAEALKNEENDKAKLVAREQYMAEITKLTALMKGRDELITQKEKELSPLKDDDPRKGAVETFIKTLRKAQEEAEISLLTKTSELGAL